METSTSIATVRPARESDCARMLELVQELAEYERAPHEVTVSLQHFIDSGFGPAPVWWAYVAEAEGQVVAFALYYIRYSTWKGQRMYLEDILVTEKYRCMGIGSLLFSRLIETARQRKLSGIVWQVLDWNEPAIKFYEKYKAKFDGEWLNASIEL